MNTDVIFDGLNESQREIAETINGFVVVDAGPGTGKTHTVVSRCVNILSQKDVGPKDLIMLTFTRNAAAEMRDRVQSKLAKLCEGGKFSSDPVQNEKEYHRISSLSKQVYIGTFDSYCLSIVKQYPSHIRRFFNLAHDLNSNSEITENESLNRMYFTRFLDRFLDQKGKQYGDLAAAVTERPASMEKIINTLMSRGIFPRITQSGTRYWFGGNDGKDLFGDVEELKELMTGLTKVDCKTPEDYAESLIADGLSPNINDFTADMKVIAAEDNREALILLIHDIYHSFIAQSVKDGHLTFGLVAMFAFAVLYDDKTAREDMATRYLIVDEFQDTNSNQMMISLMSLKEPNLCVVGDWKQGIYGFRFVSIDNILNFEERTRMFRTILNDDVERIPYRIPDEIIQIPLTKNYRSSQLVIDRAYDALLATGTNDDEIDPDIESKITYITSERTDIGDNTGLRRIQCAVNSLEYDEVLRVIGDYVDSDDYPIATGDEEHPFRRPEFRDIAILCRNVKVSRIIYNACLAHKIPAFLQGELNVMSSREGKLLLAWLKYITNDRDDWGIVPILADLGHPCAEILEMRKYDPEEKRDHVPEELKAFRKYLRGKRRRITELISDIFSFYGLDNDKTQAIISILSSTHRGSLMTISDIIRIIESDIANNTRYSIDGLPESNAVIIQTLHKSKGLEYPIVIIPRIDVQSFPPQAKTEDLSFGDITGIRSRDTVIHYKGEKKVAHSWKTYLVTNAIKRDLSEERRLLFVGISRAKQYVTLIAGKNPSGFFKHYSEDGAEQGRNSPIPMRESQSEEHIPRPEISAFKARRKNIPVHGLLHLDGDGISAAPESDEIGNRGMIYGTKVHDYAELLVNGIALSDRIFRDYPQVEGAKRIIDRLKSEGADLTAEIDCALPLNELNVTVNGRIDMFAEFPDHIEVHDWKTDVEPTLKGEYMIQLSVYAYVLAHLKNKPVDCHIDWLTQDATDVFEPVPMDVIIQRASEFLDVPGSKK